jgi:glutathione peroxidase
MDTLFSITVKKLDGKQETLKTYEGKVILVVNTASLCGFTPQYEGLQKLYLKYATKGFVVLGFPCDQFGNQEPGSSEEIQNFCQTRFSITFPLFEKVEVNGPNTHPLFAALKKQGPGLLGSEAIKWNFTKFLIDRKGQVVTRFAPTTKPEDLEKEIEALL